MADEQDRASKTEEPTPRRLEKAREDGNVAKSIELTSSVVLLAGVFLATARGGEMVDSLRSSIGRSLTALNNSDLTPRTVGTLVAESGRAIFDLAAPLLFGVALAGIVATVAQIGIRIYPKRLQPDPGKLNPQKGLKRIFSAKGAVELIKSVLKIAIVASIGWWVIGDAVEHLPELVLADPARILAAAGDNLASILFRISIVLLILAFADLAWQRWEHHQGLRMTRQEVKDESKQSEGDPQVRGRFRQAHRELSTNRMLQDVAEADVVITNPTHFAVALAWDADAMDAPRVVAKGTDSHAQRIRARAREAGVPSVERRSLARALFRAVPVGGEIPGDLYRAVAEILAWVYARRPGLTAHGAEG